MLTVCFANLQDCPKTTIEKNAIEKLVIKHIKFELKKTNVLNELTNRLYEYQKNVAESNSSLKMLLLEQSKIETSLKNLTDAIEKGIFTNTTANRINELENRKAEIDIQIASEKLKETILIPKSEIKKFFEKGLDLEPQMLIAYFVKEIILYNDKIDIIFNTPIKNNPDESRGYFSICEKKVYAYPPNGNMHKTDIPIFKFRLLA